TFRMRQSDGVRTLLFVLTFAAGLVRPSYADGFKIEVMGGSALNLPSPLVVRQDGFPDIRVDSAHYDTRPFGYYPYYSWRIGYWKNNRAWEVQQIHHRMFLTNPPPEITVFAIHFGYNYFLAGRAWQHKGFLYHLSAGPIITNPENTVRGRNFRSEPGFLDADANYFSGIGAHFAVGRELRLTNHFHLVGEAAFTRGFAWRVPVADGSANVANRALHGHLGLAVTF